MLGSLLPGLRGVRAPLVAGYLWLVGAWIVLEPHLPERSDATGVIASLYRGADVLSTIGVGAVVSFAAYLLGSLSSSTLTPLLRRFFPRSFQESPGRVRQEANTPRSPLSPQARAALGQIVRTSQAQVTSSLAFTDRDVDSFLADATETTLLGVRPAAGGGARRASAKRELLHRMVGPGAAEPVDVDARRSAVLASAVLQDLDVVAKTRLLGRDHELYAEVDRSRAEVELRLAIIPPLLGLAIAVGFRSDPLLVGALFPLVVILMWGLLVDAVRSETVANQILLQSIADRRVHSPTLERLEAEAAEQATRGQPERLKEAAEEMVVALHSAAAALDTVGTSEPALARHARRQTDLASEPTSRVTMLFPRPAAETAERALRLLNEAADAWVAVNDGQGAPAYDPKARVAQALESLAEFQAQAREAVAEATAAASPS